MLFFVCHGFGSDGVVRMVSLFALPVGRAKQGCEMLSLSLSCRQENKYLQTFQPPPRLELMTHPVDLAVKLIERHDRRDPTGPDFPSRACAPDEAKGQTENGQGQYGMKDEISTWVITPGQDFFCFHTRCVVFIETKGPCTYDCLQKLSDFFDPPPLICIFTQPPLQSFLIASAFGVPPSLCRHHM